MAEVDCHLSGPPFDHKYVAYFSGPCCIAQNACMPSPHLLVGQYCFMNFGIYYGWHVRTIICHFVLNLINTIHQSVLLVRRPGVTLLQWCAWPNNLYIHTVVWYQDILFLSNSFHGKFLTTNHHLHGCEPPEVFRFPHTNHHLHGFEPPEVFRFPHIYHHLHGFWATWSVFTHIPKTEGGTHWIACSFSMMSVLRN